MITKEDAKEYLNQMLKTEYIMKEAYDDLSKKLSDEKLKNLFISMSKEELEHASYIKKLMKLIDEKWEE